MAKNIINVGSTPNSKTGDSLRTAFIKINGNFDELYTQLNGFSLTNSIPSLTGNSGKFLTNNGTTLSWTATIPASTSLTNNGHTVTVNSEGNITVDGNIYSTAPVITVDHIPPTGAVTGNLWYDTESGRTYVRFDNNWVDANPRGPNSAAIPNQNGQAGKVLTTDGSNLSWTTAGAGGASTDVYKFEYGVLGTKDNPDTGGWGGYAVAIDPGGESNAGIYIPSVANQITGSALQIYSNHSSGGKVQITTYGGMTVSSARGTLGLGLDLEAPGAPSHFHVAFETSNQYIPTADLYFGDDYNYLRLVNTAQGVFIGTNNRTGGDQHEWRFGTDGRTTIPAAPVPVHSYGEVGDRLGMIAFDQNYIYYCKQDYVNNSTNIWVRVSWSGTSW